MADFSVNVTLGAAGAFVTCVGGVVAEYSFINKIFNYQLNDAKLNFINALYEGKYNFRINNLDVSTYLGSFNYEQHKTFTSWDTKYYINKISNGIIYNIETFNIYTATELEDGTWRLIP